MNNTLKTMLEAPIRNDTGKYIIRQCKPKLRYVPRPPLNTLDPLDIQQRILHNLRLIRITRGST